MIIIMDINFLTIPFNLHILWPIVALKILSILATPVHSKEHVTWKISDNTVDSRYLDPSYLDPITYVELISKSRLFSLCIYCISASRMSNYFYVDTSAISSIIFSPWIYFSQFLLPRISNSDHDEGKKM